MTHVHTNCRSQLTTCHYEKLGSKCLPDDSQMAFDSPNIFTETSRMRPKLPPNICVLDAFRYLLAASQRPPDAQAHFQML